MKDYYAILGVNPDADAATIRTVFRKLCHIYHPDKGLEVSQQRMTDIYEAYDVLSDPQRRAEYDRWYKRNRTRSSGRTSDAGPQNDQGTAQAKGSDRRHRGSTGSERQRGHRGDGRATGTETTDRAGGPHASESVPRARLLSWPQWRYQRVLLVVGIPTGAWLGVVGIVAKVPLFALLGMALAAGAAYVGVKTDWLHRLHEAGPGVRLMGQASLVSTIAILGITSIYLVIWVAGG